MRSILIAASCAGLLSTVGCSREPQPHRQSASEIDAQIVKVQNDPKMPANIKSMVIGQLQGQKQRVAKESPRGG